MRLRLLDLTLGNAIILRFVFSEGQQAVVVPTLSRGLDRPIPAGLALEVDPPHLSPCGSILNVVEKENRERGESSAQLGGQQHQETEGPRPWPEGC